MHAILNLGRQSLHAGLIHATDQEPRTFTSIRQGNRSVRCRRIRRNHDHLLCSVLSPIPAILGHAGEEHAMRNVPALLDHAGGIQHLIGRSHARRPRPTTHENPDEAHAETYPPLRHELGHLHYHRRHPEQILQFRFPLHYNLSDLVHPRSQHSHLRR